MTALEQAIQAAGGRPQFCKAMGETKQRVSYWLKLGYVPKVHAVARIRDLWGIDALPAPPRRRNKS